MDQLTTTPMTEAEEVEAILSTLRWRQTLRARQAIMKARTRAAERARAVRP